MKLSEIKKKIFEKLLKKIKKVFGLKSPSIYMLDEERMKAIDRVLRVLEEKINETKKDIEEVEYEF